MGTIKALVFYSALRIPYIYRVEIPNVPANWKR